MSSTSNDIADSVCRALDTYFRDLDGNKLVVYKMG